MDDVTGLDDYDKKIQFLQEHVEGGLIQALLTGAHSLEGKIKVSMNQAHHGRVYKRFGRVHQASAAGETPAIDFAALVNSIQVAPEGDHAALVFTNAEAAKPLEYGTSVMAARPFMRPAVDEHGNMVIGVVRRKITILVNEAIQK